MPAVLLPQLVDLALGTPEVGAVNFNVLHTLLHAMISKLGLHDTKAELSEFDQEFLSTGKKTSLPPAQSRALSAAVSDKDSAKGDDSILDESATESVEPKAGDGGPADNLVIPQTMPAYHHLEEKVAELAKALDSLNALPTTHEFLIEVKGDVSSSKRPVNHMWQSMQVKKRVEANEEGIEKLSTMMDELLSKVNHLSAENEALRNSLEGFASVTVPSGTLEPPMTLDLDGLLKRLAELEKIAEALQKALDGDLKDLMNRFALLPSPEDFMQFVRWGDLEDALKGIRIELEKMANAEPVERIVVTTSSQTETRPASAVSTASRPSSARSGPSAELLDILETLGSISSKHIQLENRVIKLEVTLEDMQNKLDKGALDNLGHTGHTGATDDVLQELSRMNKAIEDMQREMEKNTDAIERLKNWLNKMEGAQNELSETTKELTEDSEAKNKSIKELYDLCDRLEKKKADKEFVAREVDVKADKHQLEGKVNHHLFDNTTAEINKAIKDILDQLANNSGEWEKMLAKLMSDLDDKVDRHALEEIKKWLEQQLKALSKKIQEGNQWTEDEAAGLKRQLIQHYHCLSCDKPLEIMPTGIQSAVPTNQGMPPSRSPRPYQTYELDQIRQHAKSFGSPEQVDFYATSRQCGGQHTTTLPHQRFSRFTSTLSEEVDVKGADGQIYRGRVKRLEAKMPTRMAFSTSSPQHQQNYSENSKSGRPISARGQVSSPTQPRQPGSRSARPMSARMQKTCELPSAQSPTADTVIDHEILVEQAQRDMIELPPDVTAMHVNWAWL